MTITWKDKTFEVTVTPEIGRPADPAKGWMREKPSFWNVECAYGPYSCGFAVPMKMEAGDTLERQASRIIDRFRAANHLGGEWPDERFWELKASDIAKMFVTPGMPPVPKAVLPPEAGISLTKPASRSKR